jgi:hypothetical protein
VWIVRLLIAPAIAILALLAVMLALPVADESAAGGSISLIYIDTDITGNDVSAIDTDGDTALDAESVALGPVDECAEIAVDEEITIDIVAADWPVATGFLAIELLLDFDPAVIEVDGDTPPTYPLLGGDPQRTFPPLNYSALPALVAGAIGAKPNVDEDVDGEASSPGPIARVTLKGIAAGQTTISFSSPGAMVMTHIADGRYIPVDEARNGFISVGQPCIPGPQPGPAPGTPLPPACAAGLPDADGDGWTNCAEQYLQRDWADACISTNPALRSGYPPDFSDNGGVNIGDLHGPIGWVPIYHGLFGQPYTGQFDQDLDGIATMLDALPIWDNWAETCTDTPALPCSNPPWWSYPPPWMLPAGDVDCDGYSSADEGIIGTDPDEDCGFTPGGAAASDTWPPDFVQSNGINISDVLALKPVFNSAVPPTSARFDLVVSGGINISDVLALKPFFGDSCPP